MRIQSRQLAAFREVMRSGGMTAAASTLGISQPAVSRLITDLEESVGFRLFERLNNRIVPTAEAQLLNEQVERWHVGLDQVEQTATKIRNANMGHITMAAMSSLSVGILNRVLGDFLKVRPEATLSLEVGSSDNSIRLLSTYQADIGIVQWRPGIQSVNLIKLPSFDAICILPSGHRLAERDVVEVTDLEGEELISMHRHSALRIRTDAALLAAGINVRRRIESSVAASICELVALGFGVAVISPFSTFHLQQAGIVWKPFRPALHYEIAIGLPKHRTRSTLVNSLVDHLTQQFTRRSREGVAADL